MKSHKSLLAGFVIFIVIISLASAIEAKDSYTVEKGKIIFHLSSSEGLYPLGHIMKNEQKIDTFKFCDDQRCTGKIDAEYNITEKLSAGSYLLIYYVYDNYEWKNLSFSLTSSQAGSKSSSKASLPSETSTQTSSESGNSGAKSAIVKTICWFSTLIRGDYAECANRYLL